MYSSHDLDVRSDRKGRRNRRVKAMLQLGLVEAMQADREREIADMIRVRRLLEPDVGGETQDEAADRRNQPRPQRARAQAART